MQESIKIHNGCRKTVHNGKGDAYALMPGRKREKICVTRRAWRIMRKPHWGTSFGCQIFKGRLLLANIITRL